MCTKVIAHAVCIGKPKSGVGPVLVGHFIQTDCGDWHIEREIGAYADEGKAISAADEWTAQNEALLHSEALPHGIQ